MFEWPHCTECLWNICRNQNLKKALVLRTISSHTIPHLTTSRLTKDYKAVWSILEVLSAIQNSVKVFKKTHRCISVF